MNGKNPEPLVPVWRRLLRLLKNGVPLPEALEATARETADLRLRETLEEIARRVRECGTVGEAIQKYPDLFSESMGSLIRKAELAGRRIESLLSEILTSVTRGEWSFQTGNAEAKTASAGEEAAEPVALVDGIFREAVETRASDIHFTPTQSGGKVRLRIDGAMRDKADLEKRMYDGCIARIKILAGLDVAERVLPQEGRIMTRFVERPLELRVSCAMTTSGETAVLRVLDRAGWLGEMDAYIHDEKIGSTFRRWAAAPSGLVIITGPSGSGKTTVLYSLLKEALKNPATKVMSIEEPVEILIEEMVQLPVNRAHGVTPARLIRSVMRQDPDVLLLGEMRDPETLELVIQMVLTGHLVLTQMYGVTATEIVMRLCDMGIPWWMLREGLLGVSAQRLVRLLCTECREEYEIPESVVRHLPFPDAAPEKGWRPKGCGACGGTGYRGRNAIFEQFEPTEEFWKAVERGEKEDQLRQVAVQAGMRTMWMHAWDLIRRGDTSVQEVARILSMLNP
jgi:type II secretory ATPase GspE/PulE/Tfp pilus assembly ATPase PilB-like protein